MSLSQEARRKAIADALKLMLDHLGTKALDSLRFRMNEHPFDQVPNTTWRELEELAFTQRCHTMGRPQCQLTGLGWYNALLVTNRLSEQDFIQQLRKLSAALKNSVKSRHEDALLSFHQLAQSSGLSEDFIFNAVESRLVDQYFKMQGVSWECRWRVIRVPLNFGLRPLELG